MYPAEYTGFSEGSMISKYLNSNLRYYSLTLTLGQVKRDSKVRHILTAQKSVLNRTSAVVLSGLSSQFPPSGPARFRWASWSISIGSTRMIQP